MNPIRTIKFYLLFSLLIIVEVCQAQTGIDNTLKQIQWIDGNVLNEVRYLPHGDQWIESKDDVQDDGRCFFTYYDQDGMIRKFIYNATTEDESTKFICYYASNGSLIYLMFSVSTSMKVEEGYYYVEKNTIIEGSCVESLEGSAVSNDSDEKVRTNYYNPSHAILPHSIAARDISQLKNVQALVTFYGISNKLPRNHTKVIFDCLDASSLTIVSKNSVNIRSDSSMNSSSLGLINTLRDVRILKRCNRDSIENLGCNYWYQVDTYHKQGYIYGVFLCPAKRVIGSLDTIKMSCLRDTIPGLVDYSIPDIGGCNEKNIFNKTIIEDFSQLFSYDDTIHWNNPKDFLQKVIQEVKTNNNLNHDLASSDYEVSYNHYSFVSIAMHYEGYSFNNSYFNFDIKKQIILGMEDIIQKQKMPMLVDTINQILKCRVLDYEKDSIQNNQEADDNNYTNSVLKTISDRFPDGKYFIQNNFHVFQLKEKGIYIYYNFDSVAGFPDGYLFFTYEELKPYMKEEFKQRMRL